MFSLKPIATALLLTGSAPLIAGNLAEVIQTGDANLAEQIQQGSNLQSVIEQYGHQNSAHTDQTGPGLYTLQASVTQYGASNSTDVRQSHTREAGNVTAQVEQSGYLNTVVLEQVDAGMNAVIYQQGANNTVNASQTYVGNTLTVESVGQNNQVNALQDGLGTASIVQDGTANEVQLEQISFGPGSEKAWVVQQGSGNRVDIYQRSGRYPAGTADLQQIGDQNTADIHTNDRGHFTFVQQGIGNELSADVAASEVTGQSIGDFNRVEISSKTMFDNSLTIDQVGSENAIDAYQSLLYHNAEISQFGNLNAAHLHQYMGGDYGAPNQATIAQRGNGNTASVTQLGSY
ncbi:hypothetical protein DN826_17280 [Stutzerimonas nosocomialis]|uniref:hypothetical protein n=1 Tax=Stutzerimonas nosocomialis TaxID=1056496 RepID=UPI0011089BC5|nr:hypothetical protein [Stutzerimonas nosocomialis]TLX53666.1 hypothetical protein DN826_17280 [Stutzerimonas nosocomialis]